MRVLRRPVLALAPVAVLVAALSMFTNVVPFREIVSQNREVADTRAYLESLRASNESLESRAEALATPLEVERLAREQLGYVRPGETAFVVIEPAPPERVYVEDYEGEELSLPDPKPWYIRLWDYVTGRDLG